MIVKIIAVGVPALLIGLGSFCIFRRIWGSKGDWEPRNEEYWNHLNGDWSPVYVAELVYVTYKEYSEGY